MCTHKCFVGQVPSGDGTSGGSGNTGRRGVVSEEDKLLSELSLEKLHVISEIN